MEIASKGMVKPNNENIMIDYGSLMHSTQSRTSIGTKSWYPLDIEPKCHGLNAKLRIIGFFNTSVCVRDHSGFFYLEEKKIKDMKKEKFNLESLRNSSFV